MKFLLAIIFSTLIAVPAAAFDAAALGALRAAAYGSARPAVSAIPAPSAPAYVTSPRPDVAAASARFLGLPYVLGALGEGTGGEFDRDPLISFTGLDCTTFVEQSLAFAIGGEAGAMDALRRIRYAGGVVAYEARNHFTETDWLPNNIAAGLLRDITAEVAGAGVKSEGKVISKRAWYRARTMADIRGFDWENQAARTERLARLRALGESMDDQMVYMDYAPLADLPRLLARIPSGTVASVVRADRPDKPTLVTHQLLILDGPRGKIIRHAAQGKKVMDADAEEYVRGLAGQAWPVLGFNLAALNSR